MQVSSYFQTGWMMWNWLVTALATGASVVLYDGSPLIPSPNVLWDLTDRLGYVNYTEREWSLFLLDDHIQAAS